MQPILGIGPADVLEVLAERAGEHEGRRIGVDEIVGFDVVTMDAQEPALFGASEEFLASARLDNLSSVHAEVQALITMASTRRDTDAPIALMVANDHEEVGSATRSGAGGPFLEDVPVRMHEAVGGTDSTRRRAFAGSMVLSAYAGHAAHPNYPERHDPVTRPRLGGGPMLRINAQQRYATDAVGIAAFVQACEEASVPHQHFVSNNAMPRSTWSSASAESAIVHAAARPPFRGSRPCRAPAPHPTAEKQPEQAEGHISDGQHKSRQDDDDEHFPRGEAPSEDDRQDHLAHACPGRNEDHEEADAPCHRVPADAQQQRGDIRCHPHSDRQYPDLHAGCDP